MYRRLGQACWKGIHIRGGTHGKSRFAEDQGDWGATTDIGRTNGAVAEFLA